MDPECPWFEGFLNRGDSESGKRLHEESDVDSKAIFGDSCAREPTESLLVAGVDLAWAERTASGASNETGVALIDLQGRIRDAGWTAGLDETIAWLDALPSDDLLAFVDAPLVVNNPTGQRQCDTQVGQRYGRWNVSCNTINLASPRKAGVALREELTARGWSYDDGLSGPPTGGRIVSECYPYTTIVGVEELEYDVERPRYKRKPKAMRIAEFRPIRAQACDELLQRLQTKLSPSLDLRSHVVTRQLIDEASPLNDRDYKHREDLTDAVICAWTGVLWLMHGHGRCQVLGGPDISAGLTASIIAPARPEQRRPEDALPVLLGV